MELMPDAVLKNFQAFVAFARRRLGDPHLAEDAVQDSLVKALGAARHPSNGEDAVAWFYRILRRTLIDLHRRRAARTRALDRFESELPGTADPLEARLLCACFRRLLPAVPEASRELLERIDLRGESSETVAASLGWTRNHLAVRLLRARRHLRDALVQTCRACSTHGCLDCTCDAPSLESAHRVPPRAPRSPRARGRSTSRPKPAGIPASTP